MGNKERCRTARREEARVAVGMIVESGGRRFVVSDVGVPDEQGCPQLWGYLLYDDGTINPFRIPLIRWRVVEA